MRTDGRAGRQVGMEARKEYEANILEKVTYIKEFRYEYEDVFRERRKCT
jgi:hypothetical protein